MDLNTQMKLKENPKMYQYLKENSEWYKDLNRNPANYDKFIEFIKALPMAKLLFFYIFKYFGQDVRNFRIYCKHHFKACFHC